VFFGRDSGAGAASARTGEVEETTPVAAAALLTAEHVAYPWAKANVSANDLPAAVTREDKQP
jgi:hypothetical protein